MRFAWLAIAVPLWSQSIRIDPVAPHQGDTVRVFASAPVVTARMGDRKARFFQQSDGTRMALLPVPVLVEPGTHQIELLDSAGLAVEKQDVVIADAHFRKQNIVLSRKVASLKPSPGEMETVGSLRRMVSEQRHWDEPFISPIPGCQTSPFGVLRMHNGKPTGSYHTGVDQRGTAGTPIQAIAGGVVKIARTFNIHGGTVGLDHGQGVTSVFLHMSKIAVKEGDSIKKGDVIGYVGSTGRSTAPHLHWGLSVSGYQVNPTQWIPMTPCPSVPAPKTGK